MSIAFNQIPSNLRVPGVYAEFDSSNAAQGLTGQSYRALLVGQMTDAGAAEALVPLPITNAETAKTLFGPGSQLAQMCEAWLDNDSMTEVFAVPLEDDGAAVLASGAAALTGPATASGTLAFYVGGRRVRVAVAAEDTAAEVATALAAAINADTDLAVIAEAASGTVNLTAKNAGAAANSIDLRHSYASDEELPAGLALAVTAMHGGSGNPDLDALIAALGDTQYHIIAMPYTDSTSLKAMEDELEDRDGPLRMIEGQFFTAAAGTFAELAALGNTRNSPYGTILHMHGLPSTPWEVAAAVAGVASYYGQIDPARPFQTLEISGLSAPAESDLFTLQENNLLLYDGVSTFVRDADGTVRIQRLITTYKTNAAGAGDTAYLDLNTRLTLSYLRYDLRTLFATKYPRHKLANDGTGFGQGQAVMTPKLGKAECVGRFRLWERAGLVEGADQFKAELVVVRNASDANRLDFRLPPDLVNQFRVGAIQIRFLL